MCATEGTQWWIYDLGYAVDKDCTWKTWEEGGQVSVVALLTVYDTR